MISRSPLLVWLIFHPRSEAARTLAREIHHNLNDDAVVPGLRIPTAFCRVAAGDLPPKDLRLDLAERNFVIPLADDLLAADENWSRFVADVWERNQTAATRFVPIQLSSNAWPLDDRLNGINFTRAYRQVPSADRDAFTMRRVVVELCRYLAGHQEKGEGSAAPVRLFLSQLLRTYEGHVGQVADLAFSQDGSRLLSGGHDGTVRLWNVTDGTHVTVGELTSRVESVAFDTSGTSIISGGEDGVIIWNLAQRTKRLLSNHSAVWTRFARQDTRALIRTTGNNIELWDLRKWSKISEVGHAVLSVSISKDGERFYLASFDGDGSVHRSSDGTTQVALIGHGATFEDSIVGEQRRGSVDSIVEGFNGSRLVTTSDDKTVRIWDASTGEPLMTFADHDDGVCAAAVRPDGSALASVSRDGFLILNSTFLSTQALIEAVRARKTRQLDECDKATYFISGKSPAEVCPPLPKR